MELHLWNHRNGKLVLCFIEYPYKLQQKVSYYGLKKKTTVEERGPRSEWGRENLNIK